MGEPGGARGNGADARPLDAVYAVGRSRPQHVVPTSDDRPRQRHHRVDVAEPCRGRQEHPHAHARQSASHTHQDVDVGYARWTDSGAREWTASPSDRCAGYAKSDPKR